MEPSRRQGREPKESFRRGDEGQYPIRCDRFANEINFLYGVLDPRLSNLEYVAGDCSAADIVCCRWIDPDRRQSQNLTNFRTCQTGNPSSLLGRKPRPSRRRVGGQRWVEKGAIL